MRPDRILRRLIRERFVITLHDGQTWDGLLWDCDSNSIVLHNASSVAADGARTSADGEVIIPRLDVAILQRP